MTAINYNIESVLDTAAVFATLNPVLLEGQLGKEVDTGRFKIGDGVSAWSAIDYYTTNNNSTVFMGPSTESDNLVKISDVDGGVVLLKQALDFTAEVDQALAGSLTLADRGSYVSTSRHKAAAMLLGVFLRRVISAMGENFAAIVSEPGYSGQTIQASLAALQTGINNLQSSGGGVSDGTSSTTTTWSSEKIASEIQTASNALKNQLVGSAGEALDTIYELAEALQNNTNFVTTISDELGKTIKFTIQSLTLEQKAQARGNIGAVAASDVVLLTAQSLTAEQKTQVRANIGAAEDANLVKTVAQTLSAAEKTQARGNIGAADAVTTQNKNAGIVTGNNAAVTNESDRVANSIQILSHSRYGGTIDNGRGFLIGCATTASGKGLLKMYRAIGDGVYDTTTAALTLGGDDDFMRVFGKAVVTEDNTLNISNKIYIRPREQRTSLADATNSIDLRTCGSFVTMRPNGNITLLTDAINAIVDEGRSVALYIYPTATVTFVANDAVKWPNGTIPSLPANKVTIVHFSLVHFPGAIAFWAAAVGPTWL